MMFILFYTNIYPDFCRVTDLFWIDYVLSKETSLLVPDQCDPLMTIFYLPNWWSFLVKVLSFQSFPAKRE